VGIAEAIAHILEWNVQVPEDRVHATVEHGWVTLDGDLDQDYQRREVEQMVRGVTGVLNNITVRPPANPAQVQTLIEEMFKRQAEADAVHNWVEVTDHTARLYGQVHSLQEANADQAAASAPGVASVESHLVIAHSPRQADAGRGPRHHEGRNRDERPDRYRLPGRGHGPARLRRAHETGTRPGGRPGGCGHHPA
jgi:hypothetical protein